MNSRLRHFLAFLPCDFRSAAVSLWAILVLAHASPALAVTWQQPTPEELSMTAYPSAAGVPAVYLFREEISDDKLNFHSLYVRLKVLNEEGKKYADVEMPLFLKDHYKITDVQGRTIHSDGTIIPYTGKPVDKLIVKTKDFQYHTTVVTMPDVQVGSILEYRYQLRYDDNIAYAPTWFIQQDIPVRSAHYHFVPTPHDLMGARGEVVEGQLAYVPQLPAGAAVQYQPSLGVYDLKMDNIPATPTEEYMPPMESLTYRVNFYYTTLRSTDQFWKEEGKYWSKSIDKFASPGHKVEDAVWQIVQPADTQEQKAEKLYDAVMQIENTSFTRQHSAAENKAEGFKIKNVDDIWTQKRGNNDEITLLFIAMARIAGLKAYAMAVTNRDTTIFRPNYLSIDQLDDDIAIVAIDGKEKFLDPGQRYCAFGQMHWKHTLTEGLRQTEGGTAVVESPGVGYKDSVLSRIANLTITPEGQVSGTLRIVMGGNEALKWRHKALTSDDEQVKKDFQEDLQQSLPAGVEVKTNHFVGLASWKTMLVAMMDVSGSMGTATSKRVFLPSCFFESGSKPLFAHEKRELPIDLKYPYQQTDKVVLNLPPDYVAESVPRNFQLTLSRRAVFGATYKTEGNVYTQGRALVLASSFFDAKEYSEVRDFYQKINAQDQEQLILKAAAPAHGQ